ncbi:hypothetical protein CMI38_01345, partial [Candidatus Pacearchaeota archaeon]|nr:hypothetical protein [Candidatus Pacearchaeota archaeon]
ISDHLVQDLTDSSIPIDTWDYNNLPTLVPPIEEICDAGSEQPRNGKCTFDFTYKGDCNSGSESIVRSWTIKWDGDGDGDGVLDEIGRPEYCRKNEDTISCGNVVKLGFFGLFNLIISVLALIGVYFVLAWKKKL